MRPTTTIKSLGKDMPGVKTINFEAWGGIDNFLAATSTSGGLGTKGTLLRRVVPWLAKATNMTANAIAELPFCITKENGSEYDTSDDWKNNLGGIPNPRRMLRLLAASLCGGRAYLIPSVMDQGIAELYYCQPDSISEHITMEGLQYFQRSSAQGKVGVYAPAPTQDIPANFQGEIIYFWLPDSDVEIGPARCTPMSTALLSTELLANMDGTLRDYSLRSFIPPTIVAAKGIPREGEQKKTETWLNRFLRGLSGETKVINAEAMDIKQVGAGFAELRTVYHDLTRQQIENIGAAHGIPGALFMSDMAFASEFNEMVKLWYSTSEFVSLYQCIQETLNEQLLKRFGLRWQFKPETIDAFQEDETQRSQAYATYTDTGMRPSIAAEMLGLELPETVEYAALDEKYDKPEPLPPAPVVVSPGAKAPVEDKEPEKPAQKPAGKAVGHALALDAQQIKELNLWETMALQRYHKGKGKAEDFKLSALPEKITAPIRLRLKKAENELDIVKAFDIHLAAEQAAPDRLEALLEMAIKEQVPAAPAPFSLVMNFPAEGSKTYTIQPSPVVNEITVQPAELKQDIHIEPTPVTVKNEIKVPENKPDESKDVVKAVRKLARGK